MSDVLPSSMMRLWALGLRRVRQIPDGTGIDGIGYGIDYPVFWIDRFHPHSVRQHTAFVARSRAEVEAFHEAALAAGVADELRDAEVPVVGPSRNGARVETSKRFCRELMAAFAAEAT